MEKLIVIYDSQNKVLDMPLYEFVKIQYNNGSPFVVCNVTKEEFAMMERQVAKGLLPELNPLLVKDCSYNPYRYMMNYDGHDAKIVLTDYNSESEKGAYLISDNSLTYNEKEDKNHRVGGIKVYTTNEYKTVLNHYITETKNLQEVKTKDIKNSISDLDKTIRLLKEEKYKLYGKLYENEYEKQNSI